MSEFLKKDSDEFGTPQEIFDKLDAEFHFTVDACASSDNAKLDQYWSKEENALSRSWAAQRVFCNPPYSRGNVKAFFMKAWNETRNGDCKLAVLLIPTYTEREWFHEYREDFEVRFFKGRIKFEGGKTTARGNHMLVIFRSHNWV
jgi:phage N-6-adenine-methyltransferase